eukprot:INCI14500.1.p1 GENE.INCI14500.1~~INCI14500.1.p1  ORF type:complete len:227 (-),score=37.85 INCI14500.1:476-1156(-)
MGNQSAAKKNEQDGQLSKNGKPAASKKEAESVNESAPVTRAEVANIRLLFAKWLTSYMPGVNIRLAECFLSRHDFTAAGGEANESKELILHVETLSGTRLATFKDINPTRCSVSELKQRVEQKVERDEGKRSMGLRLFRSDPRRELADDEAMLGYYDLPSEGTFVLVAIMTSQRHALETLYRATGGKNWAQHSNLKPVFAKWCTDAPLSEWHGVTVDDKGYVGGYE